MRNLLSLILYLVMMYFVLKVIRTQKHSSRFKSWIYGFAMPSSFLTGWAFIGMADFFIRHDITFISFYFGIILFSPIMPIVFERINRVIFQREISDIVSFIHKSFFSDKIVKITSFLTILIIGVVYIFINLKALFILLGENFFVFTIGLLIILIFILFLKDWDVVTSVAFQGVIMLVSFGFISLFLGLNHFDSIKTLFEEVIKSHPNKFIINNSSFLSQWNVNILTTVFAYLFLPRQFSIIVQARDLPSKVKGIRVVFISTIFFLLYIFFNLILSSTFYLKIGKVDTKIVDFINNYGLIFSMVFFISGASFILSTFNQQVMAFSKIFENNFRVNKYILLFLLILFSLSLFLLFKDIYINTLGVFCFSSLFTLIVPIVFILFYKESEKLLNPARISMIISLVSTLVMLIAMISDPANSPSTMEDTLYIKVIKSVSISNNYFLSFFLYPNLISLLMFVIEIYSIKKIDKIKNTPISFDHLSVMDKIASFFDYNFYAISLFAFLYNNKNTEFTLFEIKEIYPIENVDDSIEYLFKKGIVKKSKLGTNSFKYNSSLTIPGVDVKYLDSFVRTFLFTRSLMYSVENDFEKKKGVYKEKIDIMNKAYKAYIKLAKAKGIKNLIKEMTKTLPTIDTNVIKIEYIGKKYNKTLYLSPYFSENNIVFPINIGRKKIVNIYLEPEANTELWFYLEPIIKSFYKNISYMDRIKRYLLKIKALDNIRTFFLSNISHEIRTPLTPLKGYISFLKSCKDLKEEDIREAILAMEESYKKLEKSISNIIEIKNLSIGIKKESKEAINIKTLLNIVIQDNLSNINRKNIEIVVDTKDDKENIYVEGDIRKLRIALDAIVDNAIKFNKENGKVFIKVFENNRFVVIKVKDTGIGIPRNEINKVFELFFQRELNDKKRYEGLGLGLSIASEIIKREGGKIKIKSKEGQGTIVYIFLRKP